MNFSYKIDKILARIFLQWGQSLLPDVLQEHAYFSLLYVQYLGEVNDLKAYELTC